VRRVTRAMKKENPGAGNFAVDFDAQLHKVKANSRTQSFFLFPF